MKQEKDFFTMNPFERVRHFDKIGMEPFKIDSSNLNKNKMRDSVRLTRTASAQTEQRSITPGDRDTIKEADETYIEEIIRQNNLLTERLSNAKDKLLNLSERLISEPFVLNEGKDIPISPKAKLDVLHRGLDWNNELASSINDLLSHLQKFL